MKIFSTHNKKGSSLLELLIYVAILSILILVMAQMTVTILRTHNSVKLAKDIESAGLSALERMTRDIHNANSINTASSTFSTNPGVLQLNLSGSPSVVKYYIATSTLRLNENGVYVGPLTSTNLTVSNLVFRQITTSNTKAVKIEFQVRGNFANASITKNFYTTAGLRGSF